MTALRVGIVGFGLAGQTFHAPLVQATERMQLAAIVSSQTAAIAGRYPAAKALSSLDALLADPSIDLVVIASPDELHCAQAIAALKAGKHVVVDKPFATTLADAREMAACAEETGRMLSVFHNRRWDADFLTLRELVGAGKLGSIMQFETHFDRFRPVPLDRWKDRRAGGVWQDLGPHLVDQALQLFGMPLDVLADIGAQKSAAPDYAHVVLRYETLRVIVHVSQAVPDHGLRFAVHGTGGSYFKHGLDPQEDQAKSGLMPDDAEWGFDPADGAWSPVADGEVGPAVSVVQRRGSYLAFYAQVRDAMLGKAANPVPSAEALAVMEVIEAGLLSAQEGRTIRLDWQA